MSRKPQRTSIVLCGVAATEAENRSYAKTGRVPQSLVSRATRAAIAAVPLTTASRRTRTRYFKSASEIERAAFRRLRIELDRLNPPIFVRNKIAKRLPRMARTQAAGQMAMNVLDAKTLLAGHFHISPRSRRILQDTVKQFGPALRSLAKR